VIAENAINTTIEDVRVLQRNLYRAAKAQKERRFGVLYDKVYRKDVLQMAWQQVKRNRGAAGVDGQTIQDIEKAGVNEFIETLSQELREKRYRPNRVKRVYIPKPGKAEKRPLGIPIWRSHCTSYSRVGYLVIKKRMDEYK
jgi:RNA-directed DNA polymerase